MDLSEGLWPAEGTSEAPTAGRSRQKEPNPKFFAQLLASLGSQNPIVTDLNPCFNQKYDNVLPLTERQLVKYLQNVSRVLYDKLTKDKWDKHVEVVASHVDLKNAVKEDPALNKKVLEATKVYTKNSTNLNELLTLIKTLTSKDKSHHIESTQFALRSEISSLRQDTSNIKSMMTQIFQAFKENSSSAPSNIVPTTTLALTEDPTTVGGECIATDEQLESPPKVVKASSVVRPDPYAPIIVPYEINGKMFQLTEEKLQAHMDKEEEIKQVAKKAKIFEMTKSTLIKVVHEEAEKIGLDP
ncbi:hypothetical protein Tco_0831808 [Tanacetum coccineum]